MKMEDLLANQQQIIGAVESLFSNFKKDSPERKTPQYINKRQNMLTAYCAEFELNHKKMRGYENQDYIYFTEDFYNRFYNLVQNVRKALQQFLPPDSEGKQLLKPATPLGGRTFEWGASDTTSPRAPTPTPGPSRTPTGHQPTSAAIDRGNASKLEEMLRKQKSNFKALARAIDGLDLGSLSQKWEYEDALRTIQSRWTAVDSLHWEIDSEQITEDVEYEKTYGEYEKKYNDIKKSINNGIWSVYHREKSTPTMDIPIFSGNYHQWTSFRDLFLDIIHSNRSLSNAQKMQFLKSKVKGEADKLIQHLNISQENYMVCWNILEQRYDNKKLILNSHLHILLSQPTMQQQSATSIKKLHDTTNECLNGIKNLGVDISCWDSIIIYLLSQKLDADTHNDYIEYIQDPKEIPRLSDFMQYLESKFTALEASRRKQEQTKSFPTQQKSVQNYQQQDFNRKPNKYMYNSKSYNNYAKTKAYQVSTQQCSVCSGQHGLYNCKTFLQLNAKDKLNKVTELHVCENCLYDHCGKACFSKKQCQHCQQRHNTLLHECYIPDTNNSHSNTTGTPNKNVTHVSQENLSEIILATAEVNVLAADGSNIKMRALIDQGSQTSLITENAAQRLGLARQRCKGVIFGIGSKENNCKGVINITVKSLTTDYTFSTDVFIMRTLINNLPNKSFAKPSWSHLQGIQLADSDFNISRPIDLLLGADIYSNIILSGIIRENDTQPIIQQSRLGWVVCGSLKSYQCNVVINNFEDISRFWAIEDIGDSSVNLSTEDQYCIQQYQAQTKRREDGRYVVRLPLKPETEEKLGESKQKAIAQFYQLEKRFQKHDIIAKDYKKFINEYLELGHMQPCTSNATPTYYLPHHCVHRADSTTTALRVVFNASAKTSSGYSLNDLMYTGPNLQADLLSLILRWRQYKIVFTADIEKMFRQIICHLDDQKYQKIVWRESNNQALKDYTLSTVTYGTKAAPFLAMMTLKQLANDEKQNFPKAASILEKDFYMDDLISGAYDIQSAKQIKSDMIKLLNSGCFNLRKWSSNYLELLDKSTEGDQNTFEFKHQESTKALGLQWNPLEDVFTFQLKINLSLTKPATKRSLLSDISKIFESLGWLCPVTTKLKLLFQSVWHQNIQWDDLVPESVNNEWIRIKNDLAEISNIRIKRWLASHEHDNIELHGFCDASENVYACVIYSKIKNQKSNQSTVVIIAAKSRLVPKKRDTSLPRLELCAALLLSNLMHTIKQNLADHSINIYGYSDSTAVLGWIQGNPDRWKPFVSNRVQKIKKVMPSECWTYIKSADNPADCASRGITAKQLKDHVLWWNGPPILLSDQSSFNHIIYETDQEIKKSFVSNVTATLQHYNCDIISDLISRHSSLTKMTRVLAWVLRVISNSKQGTLYLTIPEIEKAKLLIMKHVQQESFTDEMKSLKQSATLKSISKLLTLNPFLDKNGLLRVGGRIKYAFIDDKMKHPLIVPHDHHFTNLLIDHVHKSTFHGGARLTLAHLRQEYWIVGGIRAVKKRIHNCIKCRRHNPIKLKQIMGDLPEARCNPSRPFHHTGVDYTGYIDVKANKGRGVKTTKGYVAVFICMVTKAVHLELVSDLSSSAFLSALRRLSARRGTPRHMYSDNGTNFVGANKRLCQEFVDIQNTIDEEFLSAVSDMKIEWHFNAPYWPSAGGLWEAAVKSLKYHLRRVVGEQKLTFEEMSTLLSQLEACLNTRPLCALREDPDDINFLTPSHFLSSGPTLTIIETEKDERTRWQLVQKIFKDTWNRWQSEYLCQLSSRCKWQKAQSNIKVGDLVIIDDVNLPPGKWAMGRVTELHPGKDGYVRVVTLKTKNGVIKRPIIKLSRLPINESTESFEGQAKGDSNKQ